MWYGGSSSSAMLLSLLALYKGLQLVQSLINAGDMLLEVTGYTSMQMTCTSLYRPPTSSTARPNHVAQWAQPNYLKLKRLAKSVEVIFSGRRKPQEWRPPKLPDICHVTTINILGVTVISHKRQKLPNFTVTYKVDYTYRVQQNKVAPLASFAVFSATTWNFNAKYYTLI